MRPIAPCPDGTDTRLTDAVFLGQHRSRDFPLSGADCANIIGCKNDSAVATSATLRNTIANVIALGPKKKVSRTNARRVVASVKNTHSFWNRPVGKFPRHSMCPVAPSLMRHDAVPLSVLEPAPFPTSRLGHRHLRPEQFCSWGVNRNFLRLSVHAGTA